MTIEDTIGAILEAKLAPVKEQVGRLSAQLEAAMARRGGDDAEWLTPDEVAAELRVTAETVREWVQRRQLVASRFGRLIRVHREDLRRFKAAPGGADDEKKLAKLTERLRRL